MRAMRTIYHVRIWPQGRIRVGDRGLGEEGISRWIRADTLFSALCHAMARVWGDDVLADWLAGFRPGEAPLRLTSGFPTVDGVDFVPRPLLPAPGFDDPAVRATWAKEVKQTELVRTDTFLSWLRQQPIDYPRLKEDRALLKEAFAEAVVPRVALDRLGRGSALYHTAALTVNTERRAGFHLWLEATADSWQLVEPALVWLAEEGLGGKRTLGMGRFCFTVEPCTPEWQQAFSGAGSVYCVLSPFVPHPSELPELLAGSRYILQQRGGWAASGGWSARIRPYRVLAEGSVFSQRPVGRLQNVTPPGAPHPVYRYAIAMAATGEAQT